MQWIAQIYHQMASHHASFSLLLRAEFTLLRFYIDKAGSIVFPGFVPRWDLDNINQILFNIPSTRLKYSAIDFEGLHLFRMGDLFTIRMKRFILDADIAAIEAFCADVFALRSRELLHPLLNPTSCLLLNE